jgi:general L-amino acid transport system substrate-binding protein
MKFKPVTYDTADATAKAFDAGRCDALTSDQSQLYALRILLKDPSGSVVLPDVISKEPLGPSVRQGDDDWFNLVKWSLFAMLNAEGLGITSDNVDDMRKNSDNPDVKRFLGETGEFGKMLGVSEDWAYNIVKEVGNYSESFERNVGEDSGLKIKRGLNALWKDGGVQYAPPIR